MEITVKELAQAELITIDGRLDSVEAPRFAQALEAANQRGKYKIIVDMSQLEYMSSAGFRTLGEVQRNSKRHNRGEVLLVRIPTNIRNALEMVGFADYFHVFEDVNSALAFAANLPADDSHKDALPPLS